MRFFYLLLLPALLLFSGCANTLQVGSGARFNPTQQYTGGIKLEKIYLIVVGDEPTKQCLDYYREFLSDSLAVRHVGVTSTYDCCVDAHTNMGERLNGLLSNLSTAANQYPYVLSAVITRASIGHGTTSGRTMQLNLFDMHTGHSVWGGKLSQDFNSFVTDAQYQKVARKFVDKTIKELGVRGLI